MKIRYVDLWPYILESIANGRSLSAILREDGMPSYSWAKLQLRNNPELRRAYDQAVEDRADWLADELMQLADTPMPAGISGQDASAWVQQLRIRIDVRKWAAAKLRPKVYGERVDLAVNTSQISITAALAAANRRVATIVLETPRKNVPT